MRAAPLSLLLLGVALAPLAAAPAPLPRPAKPAPPTEVVVEVFGALERIVVILGQRKVTLHPYGECPDALVYWLRRFRESSPAPRRLIVRCNFQVLSPSGYLSLRRACLGAGYLEVRNLDGCPSHRAP